MSWYALDHNGNLVHAEGAAHSRLHKLKGVAHYPIEVSEHLLVHMSAKSPSNISFNHRKSYQYVLTLRQIIFDQIIPRRRTLSYLNCS